MLSVLLIIPAYNEEDNILKVYNEIKKYNKNADLKYDIIVINDCSTDNTSKICHENSIPVIDLIHNLGIGGAVQTGYMYAYKNNYDIAVQFDGDGQHDVNYVKNIITPIIDKKSDLVIGSRFIENNDSFKSSKLRRFGIRIISNVIKFSTGTRIYDTTSGFRACSKKIIEDFAKSYPTEYPEPITTAEIIKKEYKVSEVPVKMNKRDGGVSSIRKWKSVYYMINVVLSLLIIKIRRYEKCR